MEDYKIKKREHSKKKERQKPKKVSHPNLLIMKPNRTCHWEFEDEEETKAVIFFPRFRSNTGKKLGEFYGFKMDRRLHLDEYGTAVWKLCDGEATVRQIGEVLSEQYGEKVEPLYERLAEFFKILERNEFIEFKSPKTLKKR